MLLSYRHDQTEKASVITDQQIGEVYIDLMFFRYSSKDISLHSKWSELLFKLVPYDFYYEYHTLRLWTDRLLSASMKAGF